MLLCRVLPTFTQMLVFERVKTGFIRTYVLNSVFLQMGKIGGNK